MKTHNVVTSSEQNPAYAELQNQMHDALREQHPEWVQPNGDCPTCESYEARFAELLNIFQANEHRVAA
jgi:hypothetical protein